MVATVYGFVFVDDLLGFPGETEEQGAQKFHQGGFAGFVVPHEQHQAGRQVLNPLIVINPETVDVKAPEIHPSVFLGQQLVHPQNLGLIEDRQELLVGELI